MKTRIYIRVAKNANKVKVDASIKPNKQPLRLFGYKNEKIFLPTIAFGIDFELPDELFNESVKIVGEINISEENAMLAASIPKLTELDTN